MRLAFLMQLAPGNRSFSVLPSIAIQAQADSHPLREGEDKSEKGCHLMPFVSYCRQDHPITPT
jgi:hypothetical protein